MTMLERWKRYAAKVRCDRCGGVVYAVEDSHDYATPREDWETIVRAIWAWNGFDDVHVPEPAREYFDRICDDCMGKN